MTENERIKKLEDKVKELEEKIKALEAHMELEREYVQDDIKHLYRLHGL